MWFGSASTLKPRSSKKACMQVPARNLATYLGSCKVPPQPELDPAARAGSRGRPFCMDTVARPVSPVRSPANPPERRGEPCQLAGTVIAGMSGRVALEFAKAERNLQQWAENGFPPMTGAGTPFQCIPPEAQCVWDDVASLVPALMAADPELVERACHTVTRNVEAILHVRTSCTPPPAAPFTAAHLPPPRGSPQHQRFPARSSPSSVPRC